MQVVLSDGYYVDIDDMNYTLKQVYKGTNKSGEENDYEKIIGYYGTLKNALIRFVELEDLSQADKVEIEHIADLIENGRVKLAEKLLDNIKVEK